MQPLTGFLSPAAAAPRLSFEGLYLAEAEEASANHDAERAAMPTDANLQMLEQLMQTPTDGMEPAAFYRREVELINALQLTYGFNETEATDYLRFCREHPLPLMTEAPPCKGYARG